MEALRGVQSATRHWRKESMNAGIRGFFAVIISLLLAIGGSSSSPLSDTSSRTLLLVDDHQILYRSGTERVPHSPSRYGGNPVVPETKPWEVAIAWTSVHHDPETDRYQLWYQAFGGRDAPLPQCVSCYAESKDGILWTKPNLGLFSYGDIAETNIIMVGNGGRSIRYGNAVVVDPRDPDPGKRYKMAYFDFGKIDGKEYPGLHVAFSPDGIHWKRPDVPMPLQKTLYGGGLPVPFRDEPGREWSIPLSIADAHDVFYDPKRGVFADYAKMWIDGPSGTTAWKHAIGRSETKDFLHWSQPELILTPDDLDPPHVEFHTAPVFYYADCYFCLAQILNRAEGGGVLDVELMLSRDGFQWQRPFRDNLFMLRSEGGQFDSGSIFTNSTPVVLDDEIRFYYGAYSLGATGADDKKQVSGIGLATIPRDRFAGIRPVAVSAQPTLAKPLHHVGQVTLKPLDLSNLSGITLNADASEGTIQMEVLDSEGYRIKGYTQEDAVPIAGDSLQHCVSWKDRAISELTKGTYMFRIHLDKAAEVFAVNLDLQ
jgi:hypothetical protein